MIRYAAVLAGLLVLCINADADTVTITDDPGTIVLEYGHIVHMLAEQDPLPLLRIYGDGTAWVHYPVYMTRAGDYELKLSRKELQALFDGMAKAGLLDFDQRKVTQQRQQILSRSAEQWHISDDTDTVIRVQLARYKNKRNLDKTIRWRNVYTDAQRLPQLQPVQAISNLEQQLQSLLQRDLRPLTLPVAQR
ncbi:MAG: hypothetical protein KJO55_07110 [Gammaproteobacteria bacterium]|nr:hypothetical protein [Gammaproteobacteria bacterium]